MAKATHNEDQLLICFDCKKTFKVGELEFEKISSNFHVAGITDGSEVQACPHCGAVAFFGFKLAYEKGGRSDGTISSTG